MLERPDGDDLRSACDFAILSVLTVEDLQIRQGHWAIVDLVGKRSHIRTVLLPAWVKDAVDHWKSLAKVTSGRIFRAVSRHGTPWRKGKGGGWPGTYLDVAHGVDHLRVIAVSHHLDLKRVVVVGHSAGGHPAMWTAVRKRMLKSSELYDDNPFTVNGVIDLAGTPDMRAFFPLQRSNCGGRPVVEEMLGGAPAAVPEHYSAVSAINLLLLGVKQVLVWGRPDQIAPIALGEVHVSAAKRKNENTYQLVYRMRPEQSLDLQLALKIVFPGL